jgi:hypothetical protein
VTKFSHRKESDEDAAIARCQGRVFGGGRGGAARRGNDDHQARAPAAVVVPVEDAQRLYTAKRPSFAELLMSIPEDLETERDPSPLRVPDL